MIDAQRWNQPGMELIVLNWTDPLSTPEIISSESGEPLKLSGQARHAVLNTPQRLLSWLAKGTRRAVIIQTDGPGIVHTLTVGKLNMTVTCYGQSLAEIKLSGAETYISAASGSDVTLSNGDEHYTLSVASTGLKNLDILLALNTTGTDINPAHEQARRFLVAARPEHQGEPLEIDLSLNTDTDIPSTGASGNTPTETLSVSIDL